DRPRAHRRRGASAPARRRRPLDAHRARHLRDGSMAAMVNDGSDAHRGTCDSSGTDSPGGTNSPGDQGGAAPVRVLLVDDEALMRSGLRLMIDGARGIEVIGEAADGHAALEQVAGLGPDVV